MAEELKRPLLQSIVRLKEAGIPVALGYDMAVPYSPIHSKYCVIDNLIVLEGSFNWYNASVFSHDIVIFAANHHVRVRPDSKAPAHLLVSPVES